MVFPTEVALVKRRRELLDEFVRDHWDVFGPQAIERADIDNIDQVLYSGAVLIVRSRDFSDDDDPSEIILKIHTGLGFSEQLGLLETVADMMRSD